MPLTSNSFNLLANVAAELPPFSEALAPPLYQTSAFSSDDAAAFEAMATEPLHTGFYTRYGNPTTRAFETALAALEGGEAALATASGMGAITAALMAHAGQGDHIVAQRALYGGTTGWLRNIAPRLGIDVTFVDQTQPESFAAAFRPTTRILVLESPSNPTMCITDLTAVADLARAHGSITLVDNTIASPINQQPLRFGIDLVMHSATKYLGGHSDITAGVLVGSSARITAIWEKAYLLGATLDPFAAWLGLRGLRTLPMRVARHNETAMTVARSLGCHASVSAVHYPGLDRHPQHDLAPAANVGLWRRAKFRGRWRDSRRRDGRVWAQARPALGKFRVVLDACGSPGRDVGGHDAPRATPRCRTPAQPYPPGRRLRKRRCDRFRSGRGDFGSLQMSKHKSRRLEAWLKAIVEEGHHLCRESSLPRQTLPRQSGRSRTPHGQGVSSICRDRSGRTPTPAPLLPAG